jgi:DNA-directed RNA polymerase subunit K/omega
MIFRSGDIGKFEFVTLAALRTAQLQRGCSPRVLASHKLTTTAQHEVADGKVCGLPRHPARPVLAGGG